MASDLIQSPSDSQYILDTLLVFGYLRTHCPVPIPGKLLALVVNLYHVDRALDPLYTIELVHDKLHRFFRRRPTMDDIESDGILPNGHSQAAFEYEINSRLNRLGTDSNEVVVDDADSDSRQNGRRSSIDMLDELDNVNPALYMRSTHSELERQIKDLEMTLSTKEMVIDALEVQQEAKLEQLRSMKAAEKKRVHRIAKLEEAAIDEEEKLQKLRARKSLQLRQSIKRETELEMQLANEQIVNEQLASGNTKERALLLKIQRRADALERKWNEAMHQRVEMLHRANDEMDKMRAFLRQSQEAYAHHRRHHHIPSPEDAEHIDAL